MSKTFAVLIKEMHGLDVTTMTDAEVTGLTNRLMAYQLERQKEQKLAALKGPEPVSGGFGFLCA